VVVLNGLSCPPKQNKILKISTSIGWARGSFVWSFRKFVLFLRPSCVSEMLKWAGSRPWPCALAPVAQDLRHARRDEVRDEKLGLQSQRKILVAAQIEAAPATSPRPIPVSQTLFCRPPCLPQPCLPHPPPCLPPFLHHTLHGPSYA
jgi:hypothetical protein